MRNSAAPTRRRKPSPRSSCSPPPKKKQRRQRNGQAAGEDGDAFGVTLAGQFVKLSEKQALYIEALQAAKGEPVSWAALQEASGMTEHSVKTTAYQLSKKLKGLAAIATIRGVGVTLHEALP